MRVTVFSQPNCGPCVATKMHLSKLGIPFTEQNAQEQPPEVLAHWQAQGFKQSPIVHAQLNGITYEWAGHNRENIIALNDLRKP